MTRFLWIAILTVSWITLASPPARAEGGCLAGFRQFLSQSVEKAKTATFLASQIGIHNFVALKRGIQETKKLRFSELKALPDTRKLTSPAIQTFLDANGMKVQRKDGFVFVSKNVFEKYVSEISPDSVEFLYVPTAKIDPMPSSINQVGHIALRIGDKVYNQTGTKGFVIQDFRTFIGETKKDFRVFGYVMASSPREQETLRQFFDRVVKQEIPYSFLFNNCSQVVCRGLDISGITSVSKARRIDPYLVKRQVAQSDRILLKTYYNDASVPQDVKFRRAVGNRLFFYGAPSSVLVSAAYAGREIAELFVEYFALFLR